MKIEPRPNDVCLYRDCGVEFKDHDGLSHEFFAIYRIGSWRSEDNDEEEGQ